MFSIKETISIAWESVRTQKLRTGLTASIIAIGITALVGILTSVAAIRSSMMSSFKSLGANAISLYGNRWAPPEEGEGDDWKYLPPIEWKDALTFKSKIGQNSTVSINASMGSNAEVRSNNAKTDPNTRVMGVDENYTYINGIEIEKGRNFNYQEAESGDKVAILGADLANKLFPNKAPALGEQISVSGDRFTVIGVTKAKGNTFGSSQDNIIYLPIQAARAKYPSTKSFSLTVLPPDNITANDEDYMSLIRVNMRTVKGLRPADKDNFIIRTSESSLNSLNELMSKLKLAAFVIGLVTLLGSSIALLNIMFVSVTERTREIGTMKAIGATRKNISLQFLFEAIIIGQMGGILGILIGILLGNIVSIFMDVSFVVPWAEMFLAFAITFVVGLVSGYYPARKAAKLDPIESLRYE